MKHMTTLSKKLPAMACGEDHPCVDDAIKGLIDDPLGTLELHWNAFLDKLPCGGCVD